MFGIYIYKRQKNTVKVSNISFGAKLIVDKNVYEKVPPVHSEGYPDKVIQEYSEFLKLKKVDEMTRNDTIKLKRVRYGRGYGLRLDFICGDNPQKTIEHAGVYLAKNEANIRTSELIRQTIQFLCYKYDVPQNPFCHGSLKRAKRLIEKYNQISGDM